MSTMALRVVSRRDRDQQPRSSGAGRALAVLRRIVMLLGLPVILVAAWWFASAGSTNFLNPPLATIIDQFWPTWFGGETFGDSRFVQDVLPSLGRILIGFLIAVVFGVVLGILIGSFRPLRDALEPALEFFRAVPPPVLVPIFMLFLGIGDQMKVVVIAIGCLWPILLNTVEGVRGIDPVLKDTAHSYRYTRLGRLFRLTLPGASPQIVTGARQALSIGIILMVISEMFAASEGLGFSIVQFQRSFAIPQMWGGIILLGVLGVLLALIFRVITGAMLKWYFGYLQTQRGGS
ncbi:ABC transporter permease [Agrococcus beijingensis]|uniref:ABC transporter permease n=1 Tax=Agrococcus beijingensis TaxID=3068634 RepID=UPI0027414C78|nr:ABC transporter permease [Agrococcus sp. REN33]